MQVAALIVAAGRGLRAGGGLAKQWRDLGRGRVIDLSHAAFAGHPAISEVLVVIRPEDADRCPRDWRTVPGGETRSASVRAGLEALEGRAERVLIHDAARPLVSRALIGRVLAALDHAQGAAPGLPVTDALWRGSDGLVTGTQDRSGLWRAQTPQGFHLAPLLAAHRAFRGDAPDDVEVARAAGLAVAIVPGEEENLKITVAADFARAARLMGPDVDLRCGNGFDVHAFGPGDHVMLCGVRVPHGRGLVGHSDADVGLHALTDALLGAIGAGDIGRHFPPSDPQWRGAASAIFLTHAAGLVRAAGLTIGNADVTLICESPKIGPHVPAMTSELSRLLGIGAERVSVKATTSERLGFTGRGEGIAAIATAAVWRG